MSRPLDGDEGEWGWRKEGDITPVLSAEIVAALHGSAAGIYVNALETRNTLFVPTYNID